MRTVAEGPRCSSRQSPGNPFLKDLVCADLYLLCSQCGRTLLTRPFVPSQRHSATLPRLRTPLHPRWALEPMAASRKELPKVASQRGGGAHLVRRGTQGAGAGSRHLCGRPPPPAHLGRTVALGRGVACVDSAPGITFPGRRRSPAEPGVLATLARGLVDDVPVPSLLGWASGWEQRAQTRSTWKPVVFCSPQFSLSLRERDLFLPKFNIH